MTLWVHAYCAYRSYPGPWEQDESDVVTLIRAVKNKPLENRRMRRPLSIGVDAIVDGQRRANGLAIFADWAGAKIEQLGIRAQFVVPVPSSSCTALNQDAKGLAIATALAERIGSHPLSMIHFHEQRPPAAKGGDRRVDHLLPNLRFRQDVDRSDIILVDDVWSTGGHLRASAIGLRGFGHRVEHAFCVAHTVLARPAQGMFSSISKDLEENPFGF